MRIVNHCAHLRGALQRAKNGSDGIRSNSLRITRVASIVDYTYNLQKKVSCNYRKLMIVN